MKSISLQEFKRYVQNKFSKSINEDDDRDSIFFDTSKALKAYLIENNNVNNSQYIIPRINGFSEWKRLEDAKNWYYSSYIPSNNSNHSNNTDDIIYVLYDNSLGRVGVLYTLMNVSDSDKLVDRWIRKSLNLDHCWLSKKQLQYFENQCGWVEKGIGLKFRNILEKHNNRDDAPTLSLKAWYGSGESSRWREMINPLKTEAAISSIRWQKSNNNLTTMTTEWYNNGKITVSYADEITSAIQEISAMARRYHQSLIDAETLRNNKLCAFELVFSKKINLDAFSECVCAGRTNLKLWMIETESEPGFKRFRGVDLHTWDPIYIDIAPEYAFLTVPMNSCVNAAPRIAVIQSENTSGNTNIIFDGDDVFV